MSPAGQSIVTVTPLNDKHANGTQKKEKDEAGLEIESVEENKKLKSKNIFEESATTKTKLAKELGSPTQLEPPSKESNSVWVIRDMALVWICLLFTINGDDAQRRTGPAPLL